MSKYVLVDRELYTEVEKAAIKHKQSPEEFTAEAIRKYIEKLKREMDEK